MGRMSERQISLKELIGNNITFLMTLYGLSRKELSARLDVPYTTLCDWLKGKSYPRLDTLEYMSDFFNIEIGSFFVDIPSQGDLVARLEAYAGSLNMKQDYTHLYPEDFFDLFGCIKDTSFAEQDDIPVTEDVETL